MADKGNAELPIARDPLITIPDTVFKLTVNTTGNVDLAAVTATDGPNVATAQDLRGRFVWLHATTADVTVLRRTGAGNPANAGVGFVVKAGDTPIRMWVDPGSSTMLGAKAASAAQLEVCWDSEIT